MLSPRFALLLVVVAASLASAGVSPCHIYTEPSFISGNCPSGYDQVEVGAGPGKAGFGTGESLKSHCRNQREMILTSSHLLECSRPCTAEEAQEHMSDSCGRYIRYCREESTHTTITTIYCDIAFRDCLPLIPQDVCETRKEFYVLEDATKECKELPQPPEHITECFEAAETPEDDLQCACLECEELTFDLDVQNCKKQMCLEAATSEAAGEMSVELIEAPEEAAETSETDAGAPKKDTETPDGDIETSEMEVEAPKEQIVISEEKRQACAALGPQQLVKRRAHKA